MDRRTFLRRSFLAAIGLALVPREVVFQEEEGGNEGLWSAIPDDGRDAFKVTMTHYVQLQVKRPDRSGRLAWGVVPV